MRSAQLASWYAIDLQFQGGCSGRIDVLPTTGLAEETYDLFGEDFQASVTSPFGRQKSVRCFRGKELVLEEVAVDDMPEDVLNGCYAEGEEFIRALREENAPAPSIEDVAPSVTLCLMLAKNTEGTE